MGSTPLPTFDFQDWFVSRAGVWTPLLLPDQLAKKEDWGEERGGGEEEQDESDGAIHWANSAPFFVACAVIIITFDSLECPDSQERGR